MARWMYQRAVRRDERQVLRGDDGGACSRDDASKLDFCAGYEPAARMELAAAHGAEAMRADAAVCMLNLDVISGTVATPVRHRKLRNAKHRYSVSERAPACLQRRRAIASAATAMRCTSADAPPRPPYAPNTSPRDSVYDRSRCSMSFDPGA